MSLSTFADTYNTGNEKATIELNPNEWVEIDMSDWQIAEGSALDLSKDYPAEKAGTKGRLIVTKNAKFAFEKEPQKPVKFKGTNWRPGNSFATTLKTKDDIDNVAKAIRRAGYNLVRWRVSMRQEKEFDAPYQMKPEIRDLYDYCLYAFAREGVYTHFHLASHDLGNPSFKWNDRYDVKAKMILGHKQTWEDWRKLVKMQLEHVNPYTGIKWKDDASIISTEYFNELELGVTLRHLLSPEVKEFANDVFIKWLKSTSKKVEELNTKWKTKFKSLDEIKPFTGEYKLIKTQEFSHFIMKKSETMQAFCENVLRNEIGCKTLLHQYNCAVRPDIWRLSTMSGNYTAINVYSRNEAGTIAETCRFLRSAIAKKVMDMPFHITEYQHMPSTQNVHETGVIFPAYAALQNVDALTVHDCGIFPINKDPYNITNNPIFRANEFLSHCLFFRGDVKPSKNRFDIIYTEKFIQTDGGTWRTPCLKQTKIGLLTAISADWRDIKKKCNTDRTLIKSPYATQFPESDKYLGSTTGEIFDIEKFVEQMRTNKILPKSNVTDIKNEIYQSDTGEITLRVKEGLAKVVTAKTEAIAIKPTTKNEKLGLLTVKSTSVPASIAISSVDNKPLSKSKKIVLVYATSAVIESKNITKGEKTSVPAIIKKGKLSIALKLSNPENYKLYSLKINGKRDKQIPFSSNGNEAFIRINNAKTPTVFFELVAE